MIINVLNAVTVLESRRSLYTLLEDAVGAVSGELSGCLQFTFKGFRRNTCVSKYSQIYIYLNREKTKTYVYTERERKAA